MFYSLLAQLSAYGLWLIEKAGYVGIMLVSLLENVFTPIPSEAIIPFAGILASQGKFSAPLVILAATIGSVLGAYVFYFVGYVVGSQRIRGWIVRWGKYLLISEEDLDRAEQWFAKHGRKAVLICRVVPLVRSFISIPAGYIKMPLWEFTILTALGTAAWSTLLVELGVVFGENYERFVPIFKKMDLIFGIIALLGVAYFVYRKLKQRRTVHQDH